jgi:magnesium transporter
VEGSQHGESSLAVEDAHGHFRGLVPASKLLAVLLREHDEDFARLGGYLASTETARLAAEEPVTNVCGTDSHGSSSGSPVPPPPPGSSGSRRANHSRRPAGVLHPGVVYLADAVGTQTEALMVRGLSVGAPVRRALRLETITGPALGVFLALVSLPTIWAVLGDPQIPITVALALFAACNVATIVAAALPILMSRRGRDPAFGSGPLATVAQDLLSLVIYFAVAVLIVG